jgi:hypothetical protein
MIILIFALVGWLFWREHQRRLLDARRVAFLRWYVKARIAMALRDDRMRRDPC